MKKVTLSVTLNAQDDFETGDCKNCPVVQKQYEEIRIELFVRSKRNGWDCWGNEVT